MTADWYNQNDYPKVFYLTDTGGKWNHTGAGIRERNRGFTGFRADGDAAGSTADEGISYPIVFFGLTSYSRTQVFVTCLLFLMLDLGVWISTYRFLIRHPEKFPSQPYLKDQPAVTGSSPSCRASTGSIS